MRFMVKGIFCLPDDEYLVNKANDGAFVYRLNRIKKLIGFNAPPEILYAEMVEILGEMIRRLSDKDEMARELGCEPSEVEQVVESNLLRLKARAPSDKEIQEVQNTVCERLQKAVADGDLPASALDRLDEIRAADIFFIDKATHLGYCRDDCSIILSLTNGFSRSTLSHELLHIASSYRANNAIRRALFRELHEVDLRELDEEMSDLLDRLEEACDMLSEYTCEVLLNMQLFPEYLQEMAEVKESDPDAFTKEEVSFCEQAIEAFGKEMFVGLFFGKLPNDPVKHTRLIHWLTSSVKQPSIDIDKAVEVLGQLTKMELTK